MLGKFYEALFPAPDAPDRPTAELPIATCVVLLEAARADDNFTAEERRYILSVLRTRFQLSDQEAEEVLADAASAADESNDLWRFTHAINEQYTQEQKVSLMEEVWRIVFSDGKLEGLEDHLVHKLQHLLNLNHPQLIETKLKVMKDLNI